MGQRNLAAAGRVADTMVHTDQDIIKRSKTWRLH